MLHTAPGIAICDLVQQKPDNLFDLGIAILLFCLICSIIQNKFSYTIVSTKILERIIHLAAICVSPHSTMWQPYQWNIIHNDFCDVQCNNHDVLAFGRMYIAVGLKS